MANQRKSQLKCKWNARIMYGLAATITIMIHGLFLNYAQTIYQIRKIKIALLLKTDIFNRFFHLLKWLPRDYCLNSFRCRLYYCGSLKSMRERLNGGCEREFSVFGLDKLIGILCEHKFKNSNVSCSVNFIPCQNFLNFICFYLRAMYHAYDGINGIELCAHLKGDVIISKRDFFKDCVTW